MLLGRVAPCCSHVPRQLQVQVPDSVSEQQYADCAVVGQHTYRLHLQSAASKPPRPVCETGIGGCMQRAFSTRQIAVEMAKHVRLNQQKYQNL